MYHFAYWFDGVLSYLCDLLIYFRDAAVDDTLDVQEWKKSCYRNGNALHETDIFEILACLLRGVGMYGKLHLPIFFNCMNISFLVNISIS